MKQNDPNFSEAMAVCRSGEFSAEELAVQFEVSSSTIRHWMKLARSPVWQQKRRNNLPYVISFRLSYSEMKLLIRRQRPGQSSNMAARKIVIAFLNKSKEMVMPKLAVVAQQSNQVPNTDTLELPSGAGI